MRPTRVRVLVGAGLAGAPVGWSAGRVVDVLAGGQPRPSWLTAALLAFLAMLLGGAARAVGGWVRARRHDRWLDALTVARLLVLGKAGALFGALVAGAYAGLAVLALELAAAPAGRDRVLFSGLAALAGVGVSATALALERACRVPPRDEEDEDERGEPPAGTADHP